MYKHAKSQKALHRCFPTNVSSFVTSGGKFHLFHIFFSAKKMLEGPPPNIVLLVSRFFSNVYVPSCHPISPHRLALCLLRPTLTTTSITVGYRQPTTRNRCTRQLLVLAEGMGEGKGQDAFGRTLCGHSFSRKGGDNCHPRAAHSTKIKELQKEVGAVGLDPLRQRRDLNLGNLLSGWDFKAGTTPPLPLTHPEVWFYTHTPRAVLPNGFLQGCAHRLISGVTSFAELQVPSRTPLCMRSCPQDSAAHLIGPFFVPQFPSIKRK